MVIFIIYISAFSSFISSAEGKRRSRTQAKRKQHALKGQKLLAQGSALGIIAISKAPCKGKSLTTPIFLNPGTRIFHYIPHYIIPRMLYIPLQTNAWCDALSDCQYIAMFCPQRITSFDNMNNTWTWSPIPPAFISVHPAVFTSLPI